jgi:energy-coupling factor transporter ATP-binding protein EcfA2
MKSCFEVTFPLFLDHDDHHMVKFASLGGNPLEFGQGIYFLCGDNGSGKTTFVNMLALLAGHIGQEKDDRGVIRFNGESYKGEDFDYLRAAEIREDFFCIFPQKAFFLPVSTRDNYIVLNGSEKEKEHAFSPHESPDLLSGGQQQRILIDIVLDEKKPVWFLDEPLTNMDSERRLYFWETLGKAFMKEGSRTVFFIDHWLVPAIKEDGDFRLFGTLRTRMENRLEDGSSDPGSQEIEIYENTAPDSFFQRQIQDIKKELSRKKRDHFTAERGSIPVSNG